MYCEVIRKDLFFFQAEDGIRDGTVTGVQTCALPIYRERSRIALPLFEELNESVNLLTRSLDQIGMSALQAIKIPRATQQIKINHLRIPPAVFNFLHVEHRGDDLPVLRY